MKDSSKKSKIRTVMHEFKTGKLKSSSGDKVTNPKQAIAIALSEANMAKNKKRGGGVIMASKRSTMGEALKAGGLFKGNETYAEELAEARSVKSGKTSPAEFVKGEKSEGHKGEELENLSKQARDIKSGKMSPESYAKMEASEPDMKRKGGESKAHEAKESKEHEAKESKEEEAMEHKRGGGVIMASKKSTMGEALRGGGAIMASKRSTMGEALAKGGQVKGTGAAIKGIRPAKMY
jgi:hypothetical protein